MAKIRYAKNLSDNFRKMVMPVDALLGTTNRTSLGFEKEVGEYFNLSIADLIPYECNFLYPIVQWYFLKENPHFVCLPPFCE